MVNLLYPTNRSHPRFKVPDGAVSSNAADRGSPRLTGEVARIALVLFLLFPVRASFGDEPPYAPRVGDEYEITSSYATSSESSDGSTSSSRGSDTVIERVIGVREGGLEIEFDLPDTIPKEARARSWQFPTRVFTPSRGAMQLLNRPELEARVGAWLQAGGMTREACGRWIFTWNAFRIECDPASVIEMLRSFDLRADNLSDGASYKDAEAAAPGTLRKKVSRGSRKTFSVTLQIDPEVVRRNRAESDVVVGEIVNESVTLEEALSNRAKEEVSGTIEITLEVDDLGNVWRRTRVTEVETKLVNGGYERQKSTEVVERRRKAP